MADRAENRKFHFTYKVTCAYNGRVFYGLHSANQLNNNFSGKGYSLNESKKDYGNEQHRFERLELYTSRADAKVAYNNLKAAEIINPRRPEDRAYHIVYKTTRFDGKYYIGIHSTDDLTDGYMGSGTYIGRSLKKHGREKHICEILETCPSRDAAFAREEAIVTPKLLSDPLCMNKAHGGRQHGNRVYGQTEETRDKMSASMKEAWASGKMTGMRGKKATSEAVSRQIAALTGSKRSLEQKANLSAGLLAHYATPKNRLANAERSGRQETRDKRSASMKKKFEDPEFVAEYSANQKRVMGNPETKAKISATLRSPEVNLRHRAAVKAGMSTPQVKAKMSAAMSKPCTVDGVTVYSSQVALIKALGSGKRGSRSPNFRYV